MSDIDNEPDDTQSLVRLLCYSSDLDIEGLIATTSLYKAHPAPSGIVRTINEYAKVLLKL